jgi:hypothetical protein
MLINVRIADLSTANYNSLPLGFIVSFAFYYSVYGALKPMYLKNLNLEPYLSHGAAKWDGNMAPLTEISSIGNILYSSHMM